MNAAARRAWGSKPCRRSDPPRVGRETPPVLEHLFEQLNSKPVTGNRQGLVPPYVSRPARGHQATNLCTMTEQPPHQGIDHVTTLLHEAGWDGAVHTFAAGVKTARAAAAALGCEVGAIANSLVFDADGSPVLILTSGAHRVDQSLVARTLGVGSLARATPELVRASTGQVIGGVAPIGHPAPLPTYLDSALRPHLVIWAAAGHPNAVFSTTYDELRRITTATELDVS